jgi:hypothetical protein
MKPVNTAVSVGGRYRLEQRVAGGPSADVWRATDVQLARPVAVKLLHSQVARDAAALDRFRASASCTGSLVHEGIVRVFDYDEPGSPDAAERPFLVMEFVDGPSLAELLASGPVGAARAMDVVAQAAAALDVAHRAGRVHGDIGPHNILFSGEGRAKLTGFGAAGENGTSLGSAAGDLYALGVVARLCLTGGKASGDDAVSVVPEQIPAPVAEFVSQLTAREPADRPTTAAEISRRAARLRDQLAPAGPASQAARPGQPAAAVTSLTATVPDIPGRRKGPAASKPRHLAAMPTFAIAALALVAVALFGVLKPHGSAQQAGGMPTTSTVQVSATGLIGRPVHAVRLRLERLGLVVRLRWRPSDHVSPGKVLAVRPTGPVPAHSVITLTGAAQPPATVGNAGPAEPAQPSSPVRHRHLPRPAPHRSRTRPPHPAPSTAPASSPAPSTSPPASPPPSTSPPPSGSPPPSSSPPPASSASPPPTDLPAHSAAADLTPGAAADSLIDSRR